MEMLIDGFDDQSKKEYQDIDGLYLDVCKWSCVTCDDDQRVIEIDIHSSGVSGSLELSYVPPKLEYLYIRSFHQSELTGVVDLARLPGGIQVIDLRSNALTGEIELTQLPESMEDLRLNSNQLTGEIDLTQLPDMMDFLSLSNNQFSGVIDLTRLPDGMSKLFLGNNKLTGEIDLTHLPDGMKELYLQNNQFSGEVDFTYFPDKMTQLSLENNQLSGSFVIKTLTNGMCINAQGNQFNAIAVVDSKVRAVIKLCGSGVVSVVDANGRGVDSKRFFD